MVTVESLRQLVLQELHDFQKAIDGGSLTRRIAFMKNKHLDEIKSTEIIAERLNLRLEPQDISITPEHQLKGQNRSDFTASKLIRGKDGCWLRKSKASGTETYIRPRQPNSMTVILSTQMPSSRYFLVIWFGESETVAGRKLHDIETAQELKVSIEAVLPVALRGLIDVFVLDVSRQSKH